MEYNSQKGNFALPDHGRHKVRCTNPPRGPHSHATDKLHEHVERAIHAHYRLTSDFFGRDQKEMIGRPRVVHGKAKAPRPSVVPRGQLEPEIEVGMRRVAKVSVVVRAAFQFRPKDIEYPDECVSP